MFRYRAARKSFSTTLRWYLFQLKDCPALLWDDAFFLVGKPSTPILLFNTIVRGHPTLDIFEGDRITEKGTNEELGIVVYNNGFYLQKEGTAVRKTIPARHIYVSKGDVESIRILQTFDRTPMSFKYNSTEFDFTDLVTVEGDALSIMISGKAQRINLTGVSELLYYDAESDYKGYEGGIVDGKFLTLDNVTSINDFQLTNKET